MTAPRERTDVAVPASPESWGACRERMDRILRLTMELSDRMTGERPETLDAMVAERGRLLAELAGSLEHLRTGLVSDAEQEHVRVTLDAWEKDMEQHGEELVRRLRVRKQQTLDTLSALQRARNVERYTR